jgi:nitrogen PTS system EIIA component
MKIFNYLDQNLIFFLDAKTKEEALHTLVDAAVRVRALPEADRFYKAILEREKIVSTGIGMGVAIPHAKLPSYNEFFIAVGVLHKGIDWNALDGAFVRLIFLIGGPDDKQNEYLKILSSLTITLRDEDLRKKLQMSKSVDEVLSIFMNS